MAAELTNEQGLVLQLVHEKYHVQAAWPTFGTLDRRVARAKRFSSTPPAFPAFLSGSGRSVAPAGQRLPCASGVWRRIAPTSLVRSRAHRRRTILREVWPEVVDHLSSGVPAGFALPEAGVQLAD
ncbi:hypothetical protein [Ferrimicrobium sp.]|uniref:hypothetical protein n=1 Tax=Ferrimicrobium sp. TaxID=2926050 RepID=UPI00262EBDB9|nr:hypothetical protein [Ferrimicrobium sp.]